MAVWFFKLRVKAARKDILRLDTMSFPVTGRHTFIHTCIIHTYLHTYIHTYIHTYTHTNFDLHEGRDNKREND